MGVGWSSRLGASCDRRVRYSHRVSHACFVNGAVDSVFHTSVITSETTHHSGQPTAPSPLPPPRNPALTTPRSLAPHAYTAVDTTLSLSLSLSRHPLPRLARLWLRAARPRLASLALLSRVDPGHRRSTRERSTLAPAYAGPPPPSNATSRMHTRRRTRTAGNGCSRPRCRQRMSVRCAH